jgi:mono/diheme cytochrome c family protein
MATVFTASAGRHAALTAEREAVALNRREAHRASALVAVLVGGLAAWCAFGQEPARTVRDGIFSRAQVDRGRHEFNAICMNCHEIAEFTGAGAYLEQMEGKTVWEALEYIWAEMPEDEPASLDPRDYAAILAYTLSEYGLPAGEADMPIDKASLERVRFARPAATE